MAKKVKYIGSTPVNKDSNPSFSTFNDSFSTTIFNGDIGLTTKFSTNQTIKRESRLIITQKNVTLNDLKISNLEQLNNFVKVTSKLKLNPDKTNLSNYAVYGSLKEKYRITVNNIINKFVGGLFMNSYLSGTPYNTLLDYTYNEVTTKSTFKIPVTVIENPFFINLNTFNSNNSLSIDNLITRYEDYVLTYNDIDYNINGFTGFSTGNSSYLYFSVDGNPFSGNSTPQNIGYDFLIKPNDIEFNKFYDSLNELERYFLNKNSTPKYTFSFKIPQVDEDGNLTFSEYVFNFPIRYDGYNLDTESITYVTFLEKLFQVGDLYDEYKSNLIIRKLIPKTLVDLDVTNTYKSESIFKIYGKEIDEIKMFIDSLMNINATSYDKVNNIPDTLIKNLAKTLSWKARNIVDDKDLISSVFANNNAGTTEEIASLAEVDIEVWRRLVINTAWFMKSKGTRKSIEAVFSFIGAPECLLDFKEYVYVVDGKINPKLVDPTILIDTGTTQTVPIPYDEDGYPVAPKPTSSIYFQKNGNEDGGQFYIDLYRKLGFNVTKTVDNKKSWVYYETANTHSSSGRNTYYEVNDSRLIINTKEISLSLDIATAIECDVYNFNKANNYPVTTTGRTVPYPQRESNKFDANSLSFAQYIDKVYSSFINVQNRKVSDSAIGSYYPSLTKLYYDYLNDSFNDIGVESNKRRFRELMDYVDNIDAIFNDFVKQFIPATTITEGGGVKIRNTIFTPQKFVYKQGIDDGSEFEASVSFNEKGEPEQINKINTVIIESEFFEGNDDSLKVVTISTEVKTSNTGNIDTEFFATTKDSKNIQPTWDATICENEIPNSIITGATKIELSSLTNNQIFNKSTGTTHTLIFDFTSATQTLSASTTEFYFNIHRYDKTPNILGFSDTPIYTFSASSTAFTTSSTISVNVPSSVLSCDSDYIVKPYFKLNTCSQSGQTFTASSPYTTYEDFIYNGYYQNYSNSLRFFDYTKFKLSTGNSISSLIPNNKYSPLFRNYNTNYDYYFISYCQAPKPIIDLFAIGSETEGLVTETIDIVDTGITKFSLQYKPIGDIVVAVNGITILKDLEYSAETSTLIPPSIRERSYVLMNELSSDYNDVLTVSYYKNPQNGQKLIKENFEYTASTNISSTGINFYIDLTYQLVSGEAIVYWNGTMLAQGIDYTFSSGIPNRINLDSTITLVDGDSVSVVYFIGVATASELIRLTSSTIPWSINTLIPENSTGIFTHEFFQLSDTGFTGTSLYSLNTNYLYDTYNFSQTFDFVNASPLVLNQTYNYRIKSEKYFKTINNIGFTSTTYSDGLKVKLPN